MSSKEAWEVLEGGAGASTEREQKRYRASVSSWKPNKMGCMVVLSELVPPQTSCPA